MASNMENPEDAQGSTVPGADQPYEEGQEQPVQGLPNRPGEDAPPANQDNPLFHYDTYWLRYVPTLLDTTLPTLRAHLKGYTTYLNTLSFTTFFGGIALSTYLETSDAEIFVWLIVPIIVLQLAKYWLKVKIGAPTIGSIDDLRVPEQIHGAYNSFVDQLQQKLKNGGYIVGFATVTYLFCIPIAIFEYNKKQAPDFDNYAYITTTNDQIVVRAQLQDAQTASLIITGTDPKTKEDKTLSTNLLLDENQKINANLLIANLNLVPKQIRLQYAQNGRIESYTYATFTAKDKAATKAKSQPSKTDKTSGLTQPNPDDPYNTPADSTATKKGAEVKR